MLRIIERPTEHDAATVRRGGVHDLLDAVHMAREARDDDPALRLRDDRLDDRADVALERCEAGHVGVRRVEHREIDALLAEPGECAEVGDPPVERELVHLEVAGMEHHARGGADRDRERVGNRVVHRDELEVEGAEPLPLPLLHRVRVRRDPVLLELRLDEGEGELAADERNIGPQPQEVRHRADVVLVPVGENDRLDPVEPVPGSARSPGG